MVADGAQAAPGPGRGRGRGRGRGGRGGGRGGSRGGEGAKGPSEAAHDTVAPAVRATPTVAPLPPPNEDAEICFICAEPIALYSVPPCNHRICHICSMRLRALWKKRDCTFCKGEATSVIFTPNATRGYGEFTPDQLPYADEKLSISFERKQDYDNTIALLRFNCPIERCEVMSAGWTDLKTHVKRDHSRLLCDLCIKHKKIFSHEHAVYTAASLQEHLSAEHRYCEYCRQHFYSDDELWVHMRDRHEQCHICKGRSEEERWRYYKDYRMLEQHFQKEHYLCPARECLEQKFVVFENQMEFQVHQVQEHGKTLSSREKRDALRVDANFLYESEQPEPSSSRRRKKGREGVSIQAEEPAPTSSRRAQFGHALTEPEARPEQQQSEKYWSTVLTVLNDSQIKLTACRSALQAYRASELSVHDLLNTVMNITGEGTHSFDVGTTDLVIQSLAEIVQNGEKRKELLDAWADIKGKQNRFPTPMESHGGAVRQLKNAASGNNRVWENVARAASNAPSVRSQTHFPQLGASNASRVPGSAAHTSSATRRTQTASATPWSAPQPRAQAAPARPTPFSVAAPRARGAPRASHGESQFPSLPTNAGVAQRQAEKRQLLGQAARPPPRSWGAPAAPPLNSSAFPSLSEVSGTLPQPGPSTESVPVQGPGKQRRKKGVLLSSVSSMHHV